MCQTSNSLPVFLTLSLFISSISAFAMYVMHACEINALHVWIQDIKKGGSESGCVMCKAHIK